MSYRRQEIIDDFPFVFTDGHVAIRAEYAEPENPAWQKAFREALRICPGIDALQNLQDIGHYLSSPFGLPLVSHWIESLDSLGWEVPEGARELFLQTAAQNAERQRKAAEREARANRPNPGFVYLLQSTDGCYKIGRAKDVNDRVRTFNVKLPMPVELTHVIKCNRYTAAESELHKRYAHRRVNGEWFALTPEEVAEIKAITEM